MPQLISNDNRYTLFSTQRTHVLEAARDLLRELDETNEELKSFIRTVKLYIRDYATHPQISINFLKLLNSEAAPALLPKNELLRLQKALENDQALMSERNRSYVSKRNSVVGTISPVTFLLSMVVSMQLDDIDAKFQLILLGSILTMGIQQLKINDSVNDWDYLGMEETDNIEDGQERDFQPMQIH